MEDEKAESKEENQLENSSPEDGSKTTSSSNLTPSDADAEKTGSDEAQYESDKQKMETEEVELSATSQVETTTDEQRVTPSSKNKQRKCDAPEYFGTCDIPVFHKVEFDVGISFGLYFKQLASVAQVPEKKKNDAPAPLGFFHVELRLLPNDDEIIQMDIIPYINFVRILVDKNESKTIKYYNDGQLYWVIWHQIFEVEVTNDLLLQLFDYTIEVNVWDSKEKLMTRSRFDKPRGLKFDIDEADVKKQVNFQKGFLGPDEQNPPVTEAITLPENSNLPTSTNIASNESEFQLDKPRPPPSSKTRGSVQSTPIRKGANKESREPTTKAFVCLRYFFSDQRNITKRLEKSIEGMVDMLVSVTLNRSLLSEQQKRSLNPVVINVHSVTDLPGSEETGHDYSQLKAKCFPVYLKYKFIHNKPYKSPGKPHQRDIIFDDINVILTGNMDSMELREYFLGPGLLIEIHDRDRKPSTMTPQTLLYGDDLNDEKLSNIGVITSKMTKINPYKSPPANSLDPFGVARFDLSGFTVGQSFSYQELTILNGPTLDSLQNAEAENNFVKKVNSDSRSFLPGQYLQSGAMINITVKLAYPLIIPPIKHTMHPVTPTYNCPFGRMVFMIGTARQEFLEEVLLTIARINGEALGLTDVPDNILIATLLTLITTRHQRFDRLLDIITGFHIIDTTMHVLVIEGLQHQGIQTLIDRFGETDYPDVKILYNTSLVCSDRLYASFDVILRKVKLHEPLDSIVKQPLIYIRDMVPRLCYDALIQLHELKKCFRLLDAMRNNLFPTANMVRSLSKEFGVVIKEEQLKIDASAAYHEDSKQHGSLLNTLAEEVTDHHTIKWRFTDHMNKSYIQMLKRNLHSAPADIISRNIDSVSKASKNLKAKKVPEKTVKLSQPLEEVHNYGMSTYNTVELKKLELRRNMDPKSMYTYCPDFHHSMTFAPMELEHVYKEEEIRKMKKWRTSGGWVYPGFKSSLESYVHPKKPSSARIKELSESYSEKQQSEYFDPRERCAFTWSERNKDMDIWRQPTIDTNEKVHVIQCEGNQYAIDKENDRKQAEDWKSKVIVKNTRTRIHRQLTETELKMQGRSASCQLDRMKGLLKGKPIRRAFKYRPVAAMPSLDVVNYPELSANAVDRKLLKSYEGDYPKSGFSPGPLYLERSLKVVGNYTPMPVYEHDKFAKSKGEDFKTRHMRHDPIFKGKCPVLPVSEEEKYTDYRNQKNSFCRSHTVPEICRPCICPDSGPPYTADADMERSYNNNNWRTNGKNITGVKTGSPEWTDH